MAASSTDQQAAPGDPWQAFSYLVTGVLFYGGLGWLADRWLDTSFLVVVGVIAGAGLGMYMTWARFRAPDQPADDIRENGHDG